MWRGVKGFCTLGLGSWLSTYWPTTLSKKCLCNHHTYAYQTPIPCVPVASRGLKPTGRVCEEWMLRRSQTGQAWLEVQSQQMQWSRDWGARCANYPRNITTFLPSWCWLKTRHEESTDFKLQACGFGVVGWAVLGKTFVSAYLEANGDCYFFTYSKMLVWIGSGLSRHFCLQ